MSMARIHLMQHQRAVASAAVKGKAETRRFEVLEVYDVDRHTGILMLRRRGLDWHKILQWIFYAGISPAAPNDVWTVDGADGHFEHNGTLIGQSSYIKCIRASQEVRGKSNARLSVELRQGGSIIIGEGGTWAEFADLAWRLADYAQVPLSLKPQP